jgi:hypothetical protein
MWPEMRPTGQQQALNVLTLQEQASFCTVHTPRSLLKYAKMSINYEHYACLMVHPITGQKKQVTKTVCTIRQPRRSGWQTAFCRDFGKMAQGDNKTGLKGTNAMFVMMHNKNALAHALQIFFTYSNPVVDYHPQKEFPH